MLNPLLAYWITLPDAMQYAIAAPPFLIGFLLLTWWLRRHPFRHVVSVLYLASLMLTVVPMVQGTTTFVDGDCPNAGNGSVDACAGAPGGNGQFNNLQTALDAQDSPGDTLVVHAANGTEGYVGANVGNTEADQDGSFHMEYSGSASNYIVVKNAPGETPIIRPCASSSTALSQCNSDTLTFVSQEYIKITDDNSNYADGHLKFIGRVHLSSRSGGYPCTVSMSQLVGPIELSYLEIEGGYDEATSGNWTGIWIICRNTSWIHHVNVHDITDRGLTGVGPQSSASCISYYHGKDVIVEYFTCTNIPYIESQGGCFDLKSAPWNDIVRYSLCRGASQGVRMGNCTGCPYPTPPGWPSVVTGNRVYGNVLDMAGYTNVARYGIRFTNGPQYADIEFSNNTVVGYDACVMSDSIDTPLLTGIRIFNNICAGITNGGNDAAGRIIFWMPASPNIPATFAYQCDESTTVNATPYRIGGSNYYDDLADLQASSPYGVGSVATTGTGFGFTNLAGFVYTLTGSSACRNVGRVGGIPTGAQIDAGAYGITSCIGHLCGGTSDTTPPVISITAPTSGPTYSTQVSPLPTLAGTCTDINGVSTVTWSNNQGGTGTASGTTTWQVTNIPLFTGTNVLTVTCQDLAGNVASDALAVTYTITTPAGRGPRSRVRIR